jgi:hypothetical protein
VLIPDATFKSTIAPVAAKARETNNQIIREVLIFAERFRSDISSGGTQSGSAATVTLHEIVCNAWFGSVVFISGSRDIHARGFDIFQADGFS